MPLMKSWVAAANAAECPFPLNNLPYGVFSTAGTPQRCGVAIGDLILDLAACESAGLITSAQTGCFARPYWNDVMAQGAQFWHELRAQLIMLLAEGSTTQNRLAPFLVAQSAATMHLPIKVAEYTDFYANKHHAMNVGAMFRGPENALPPNWLHIPIGYNGRASSVVVSGTDVIRPNGQTKAPDAARPSFGPSKRLDIELEIGAIVGTSSLRGHPITVAQADEMIFGYVLLNDWSARDIQSWEYQPLGPFQSKAFATSISPWIVTRAALEPFRCSTPTREVPLLPYLYEAKPLLYDIDLSVTLAPAGKAATTLARTNYNKMYFSAAQQLAHHASSGCAMTVGDLLGSGTISGPEKSQCGSLLEMSWGGRDPIPLTSGGTRTFIEDFDTLTLHGEAQGDGYLIGFGDCVGMVLPAVKFPE